MGKKAVFFIFLKHTLFPPLLPALFAPSARTAAPASAASSARTASSATPWGGPRGRPGRVDSASATTTWTPTPLGTATGPPESASGEGEELLSHKLSCSFSCCSSFGNRWFFCSSGLIFCDCRLLFLDVGQTVAILLLVLLLYY